MGSARIEEEIWTDPKMKSLTPGERLLFIWLFSNPYRHFSGLYYLPAELIPKQTGLTKEEIDRGMDTLIDRGIVRFSNEFETVFVVNMLARQTGKAQTLSPTQKEGILKHLETLHQCPLIIEFIDKYSSYGLSIENTRINTPIDTPTDTYSKSKSKSKSKSQSKDIPAREACSFPSLRKSPKIKTSIPDDFQISEAVHQWAVLKGYDRLEDHLEAFKDRAIMKGYTNVNWDRAFMVAIREDWGKIRQGGGNARGDDRPRAPTMPEDPPGILIPAPDCKTCGGMGLDKTGPKPKPCFCLHPEEPRHGAISQTAAEATA